MFWQPPLKTYLNVKSTWLMLYLLILDLHINFTNSNACVFVSASAIVLNDRTKRLKKKNYLKPNK